MRRQHGHERNVVGANLPAKFLVQIVDVLVEAGALHRFRSVKNKNNREHPGIPDDLPHRRQDVVQAGPLFKMDAGQKRGRVRRQGIQVFVGPDFHGKVGVQLFVVGPDAKGVGVAHLALHPGLDQPKDRLGNPVGHAPHGRGRIDDKEEAVLGLALRAGDAGKHE